jgi:hypothetical protein
MFLPAECHPNVRNLKFQHFGWVHSVEESKLHNSASFTYLVSFHALGSLFLFLFPDDDEGTAKFVESETHM